MDAGTVRLANLHYNRGHSHSKPHPPQGIGYLNRVVNDRILLYSNSLNEC